MFEAHMAHFLQGHLARAICIHVDRTDHENDDDGVDDVDDDDDDDNDAVDDDDYGEGEY